MLPYAHLALAACACAKTANMVIAMQSWEARQSAGVWSRATRAARFWAKRAAAALACFQLSCQPDKICSCVCGIGPLSAMLCRSSKPFFLISVLQRPNEIQKNLFYGCVCGMRYSRALS